MGPSVIDPTEQCIPFRSDRSDHAGSIGSGIGRREFAEDTGIPEIVGPRAFDLGRRRPVLAGGRECAAIV